ncbi:MAG: hypothetical protein OXF98_08440 [Rhodospirillaceae bacterium]|nr:hypothetical protein [Rhodospirillaceae bacterium]
MARRGLADMELRERLAQEAARLVNEHGIQDYGLAKRKAAQRFGVRTAGALPSNAEIEARVTEWQRIFEPDSHRHHLAELRRVAVDAMALLTAFEPRLSGSVLTGAITVNSPIELHLFTDAPEDVVMTLEAHRIPYRDCQRRCRYDSRGMAIVPGYRFTFRSERIDALVFPEKGLRQAPMSPVDRRPMPRARRDRVLELLKESG